MFLVNSFNIKELNKSNDINVNHTVRMKHNLYLTNEFDSVAFTAKTIHTPEEIQRFKEAEKQAKFQRSMLPISVQIMYPLKNYPNIKLKDLTETNSKIINDYKQDWGNVKKDIVEFLLNNKDEKGQTLSEQENIILSSIINDEDASKNAYSIMPLIREVFSDIPEIKNISDKDKALLLHNLKFSNIDGSALKMKLIPEYISLIKFAKENKESLTEPVQEVMNDEEIGKYFNDNLVNIITAMTIIDSDSLKLRLSQRLNKFDSTIKSANNLLKNNEINSTVISVCRKPNKQNLFEIIKFVELANGIMELGVENGLICSYLNMSAGHTGFDIDLLSKKYLNELGKHCNIKLETDGWDNDYVYTIPSFMKKGNDWHKIQLLKLITTSDKLEYRTLIHDENNPFGKANINTKNCFAQNGLDYEKWLNYSESKNINFYNKRLAKQLGGTVYSSKINPHEQLSYRIWNRDPKKDLFQGSTGVQCIALDGINCNAGVDELLYTYAQLIELYNKAKNKAVGNACVYWIKDCDDKKAMVIDSVSVHPDYQNDFSLRKELFDFAKSYAKDVSGEDVKLYIGNQFNKFDIKDLSKPFEKEFSIIGDTNNKNIYLDAIIAKDAASRYVDISKDKQFKMELREIK